MEYFIIWHQHQTRSGKIKTNKTQQISIKTQVSFVKTELRHIKLQLILNHIIFVDIFFLKSLTHEKVNRIRIFLT